MKHLSEVPKPPSELRADVPPDLDLVVLRALAKDPSERYQSAEEMDADLERILNGLPVGEETAAAATAVLAGSGLLAAAPTSVITRPTEAAPTRAVPPGLDAAGRLLRLRGAAAAPAAGLAVGARRPAARRRRGRGVVRVHEDPGPAQREQAGRRSRAWSASASRSPSSKLRERTLVPHVTHRPSTTVVKGYVIDQSPNAGPARREEQHRRPDGLDRQAEGAGARRDRQEPRRRGQRAHERRAEGKGGRDPFEQDPGHRHRPVPARGHEGDARARPCRSTSPPARSRSPSPTSSA